jgi:hypothetical protein
MQNEVSSLLGGPGLTPTVATTLERGGESVGVMIPFHLKVVSQATSEISSMSNILQTMGNVKHLFHETNSQNIMYIKYNSHNNV